MGDPIPITRAEYAAKFGAAPSAQATGPIPITRAEYAAKFGGGESEPLSLFSDPIGALTSADWWLTRPSGERISAGQAVAGPALKTLDALTFGAGDEIAAGGGALVDYLGGDDLSASYERNLSQARGAERSIDRAAPAASTALQILSSLKNPVAMTSQVGRVSGAIPKIAQAVAEGGAIGGLYGIGEGEGGAENRLRSGADSAKVGAVTSGLITGALQGGSALANRYSGKLANAADETVEKGLGIQYGERKKGLNKVNLYVNEDGAVVPYDQLDEAASIQAPIQQQVETLKANGILEGAPDNVQALKLHLTKKEREIGKTIPLLVREADEVIGGAPITPEFTNTAKFLEGYRPATRAKLEAQFEEILSDYQASPGTGLSKLTKYVDQLQRETNFDSAVPKEITQLKRMIQYDMRKTSERIFDEVVPAQKGAFANANNIVSSIKSIGKTLNTPMARKTPEFLDYIKGGSLPMTVGTGLAGGALGIGPAAMLVGGRLAYKAAQQFGEAAYPMSTAKLYAGMSEATKRLAENLGAANGVAGPGVVGALAVGEQLGREDAQIRARKSKESARNKPDQPPATGTRSNGPRGSSSKAYSSNNVRPISLSTQDLFSSILSPDSETRHVLDVGDSMDTKEVEALIDADPIDAAIYEVESARNPKAKNKASTASGGFQLISKTAKALGVKDVFDLEDNYKGYKKLRAENEARFGSDPLAIYSAHYLGATLLDKWMKGKSLTKDEEALVRSLKQTALPRFKKVYEGLIAQKSGSVEA